MKSEIYDKLIILLHLIASWIKVGLKDNHYFNTNISHKPPTISVNLSCQMMSNLFL